jgi:hypothetical protein
VYRLFSGNVMLTEINNWWRNLWSSKSPVADPRSDDQVVSHEENTMSDEHDVHAVSVSGEIEHQLQYDKRLKHLEDHFDITNNPYKIPEYLVVHGYLGNGPGEGARIYLNHTLSRFIDVPPKDIHLQQEASKSHPDTPLGGSYLWILGSSEIKLGNRATRDTTSHQAKALIGKLGTVKGIGEIAQANSSRQNSNPPYSPYCGSHQGSILVESQNAYSCPITECCSGPY